MKPEKHIRKFYDLIHRINEDGHIDKPNKWEAMQEIEAAVHKLRQAFDTEIKG